MPALQIEDETGEYWVARTEYDEIAVTDNLTGIVIWVPKEVALTSDEVSPYPFRSPYAADRASQHESLITMVREHSKDVEFAICYKSIVDEMRLRWVPRNPRTGGVLSALPRLSVFVKQEYEWSTEVDMVKDDNASMGVVVKKSATSAEKLSRKHIR